MALGELTTHSTPVPIQFDVPAANPSPQGLWAATTWNDSEGPSRFLTSGVDFRTHNFGGDEAFGIWGAGWCVDPDDLGPDDIKDGVRPSDLDTFAPLTVWAYDDCDLTPASQDEVRVRVTQNLRLREQVATERELATRLITDAPALTNTNNFTRALGQLEGELAKTGILGVIHVGAQWAAVAAQSNLIKYNGAKLTTPLGHQWVFGGGYVEGLGARLVATSPTYGWRDAPEVRATVKTSENRYVAVAERSLLIGYERAIATIQIA